MRAGYVVGVLLLASFTAQGHASQSTPGVAAAPDAESWPAPAVLAERKRLAEDRPLFAESQPLTFTLRADFKAVQRDRDPESTTTYPATLVVPGADGTETSMPIRIRTRGHSRRKPTVCAFAPLRLEFESNPVGTVFEGHKNLKLGTHCRDTGEDEQYVLREYAVYRMFNVLTPRSFRVRLGSARYVDAKSGKTVSARAALFLEDDDDVARRLEGRATDEMRVSFRRADLPTTTLMTIFEYMIGNTDMSILGLHNVRLVQTPAGTILPIPYDFDYSGVVDARYALPDPRLHLSSVRDRVYRGPCRTPEDFERIFGRFRDARSEMMAVYDSVPNLKAGYARQARHYLDEFYRVLERPANVKRAFIDGCLEGGM